MTVSLVYPSHKTLDHGVLIDVLDMNAVILRHHICQIDCLIFRASRTLRNCFFWDPKGWGWCDWG